MGGFRLRGKNLEIEGEGKGGGFRGLKRSLRLVLGVEKRTPGYLVREKLQREKLVGKAGKRAYGFDERLKEGKGSILARKCLREMRERWSR